MSHYRESYQTQINFCAKALLGEGQFQGSPGHASAGFIQIEECPVILDLEASNQFTVFDFNLRSLETQTTGQWYSPATYLILDVNNKGIGKIRYHNNSYNGGSPGFLPSSVLTMRGGATIALKSLYVEGNGGIAAVSFISVAQNVHTGTQTPVSWLVPLFNGGGFFNATQPTRLTAPHPGTWVFNFHLQFAANATGNRALQIRVNGATYLMPEEVKAALGGGIETALNLPLPITFTNGGDYIEVMSSQTSGADLNLLAARVEIQQP